MSNVTMSHVQALFQLGMDLDPDSSTVQGAPVTGARAGATGAEPGAPATGERRDFYIKRDGVRYAGTRLIVDLWEAERRSATAPGLTFRAKQSAQIRLDVSSADL